MDDLDMGILREMSRGRVLWWGGVDPRVGRTQIADRLGVNRTTVWHRLKAWQEDGFLVRQEVVPNPCLFGAGIAGGGIHVPDPRRRAEVIASLRLVDGVLGGFDQVGPWIVVAYAHESNAGLNRCMRLVGALPGVDGVSACIPFKPPRHAFEPDTRDWRILAAMRRAPRERFAVIARDAGVSTRTLTRRYNELLKGLAFWSVPILDFTRYRNATIARFDVILPGAAEARAFESACRERFPNLVWLFGLEDVAPNAGLEHTWVDAHFHLATPGEADDVHQALLDMPGVEDAELFFPKTSFMVTAWFDERIEAQLAKVGANAPRSSS